MTDHTQLRKLAEAATPGPLCVTLFSDSYGPAAVAVHCAGNSTMHKADAEFIASANPQAVLELLDEIERLKEMFRVNMLCAFPEKSHDEITAEIEKALK